MHMESAMHLFDSVTDDRDYPGKLTLWAAAEYHADREWADGQGWSKERRRRKIQANLTEALRVRAVSSYERLKARGEPLVARLGVIDAGNCLPRVFRENPTALPLERVARAHWDGFFAASLQRKMGSRKAVAQQSSIYDLTHLVGAAYCSVFTRDQETSRWLGETRTGLGFNRQFAVGELGAAGFVGALMSAWTAARGTLGSP